MILVDWIAGIGGRLRAFLGGLGYGARSFLAMLASSVGLLRRPRHAFVVDRLHGGLSLARARVDQPVLANEQPAATQIISASSFEGETPAAQPAQPEAGAVFKGGFDS